MRVSTYLSLRSYPCSQAGAGDRLTGERRRLRYICVSALHWHRPPRDVGVLFSRHRRYCAPSFLILWHRRVNSVIDASSQAVHEAEDSMRVSCCFQARSAQLGWKEEDSPGGAVRAEASAHRGSYSYTRALWIRFWQLIAKLSRPSFISYAFLRSSVDLSLSALM